MQDSGGLEPTKETREDVDKVVVEHEANDVMVVEQEVVEVRVVEQEVEVVMVVEQEADVVVVTVEPFSSALDPEEAEELDEEEDAPGSKAKSPSGSNQTPCNPPARAEATLPTGAGGGGPRGSSPSSAEGTETISPLEFSAR